MEQFEANEAVAQPLSFDEFQEERNNFHIHFWTGEFGKAYQQHDFYKKCVEAEPGFATFLNDPELKTYSASKIGYDESGAMVEVPRTPARERAEAKLYQAYLVMRKYAKNDRELFR